MENVSKIHKLTLDITYSNAPVDNYALTGRIRNLFDEELEDAIDSVFQRTNSTKKIYIDTCIIDLGNIEEKDFSSLLATRLKEELETALQSSFAAIGNRSPVQENFTSTDIIIYFLSKGRFPWYAPLDTKINTLFEQTLAKEHETFSLSILTLFTKHKQALYRFVIQFEEETILSFFKKATRKLSQKMALLSKAWIRIIQSGNKISSNKEETLYTFGIFLSEIATGTIAKDDNLLIHSFIDTVVLPSTFISTAQAKLLQTALQVETSTSTSTIQSIISSHIENMQPNIDPTQSNSTETNDSTLPGAGSQTTIENNSSIAVENAGLVLLGIFFPSLFMHLNLLKDGKFISLKHQERAVQVLHHLVANETETPEHQLPLCKILAGLPIHHPIGKKLKLSEAEKEICNDLFHAALNNWDKMKSTSKAGFQGSFIQRNGSLSQEGEDWTLTVEKRGYDVLLQTLPWPFSIYYASWSKCMLQVNWL